MGKLWGNPRRGHKVQGGNISIRSWLAEHFPEVGSDQIFQTMAREGCQELRTNRLLNPILIIIATAQNEGTLACLFGDIVQFVDLVQQAKHSLLLGLAFVLKRVCHIILSLLPPPFPTRPRSSAARRSSNLRHKRVA